MTEEEENAHVVRAIKHNEMCRRESAHPGRLRGAAKRRYTEARQFATDHKRANPIWRAKAQRDGSVMCWHYRNPRSHWWQS